jgi:hypothetical protein
LLLVKNILSQSLFAYFFATLSFSALWATQVVAQPGAPIRVSGTQVSLTPPEGFRASTRFSGFESAEAQASIMITELPGPFSEVAKMLVPEQLAKQRMTLLSRSDEKINGSDAILAHVAQRHAGDEFSKWMLIVGNETKTRMIVATFPKENETSLKDALRKSVLSATWTNDAVDPFDGLNYKLQAAGTLKLAGRVSNLLMFTESGKQRTTGPEEALFIFGSSIADRDLSNLKKFAEDRVSQTARMSNIKIQSSTPVVIAGLKAHEIVASANDDATDKPMLLYQTLLADDKTYYIAQGVVTEDRGNAMLPHFKATAKSFIKR